MILFLQVMWLLCIKRRPWIREDNWLSPAKEICDYVVALEAAEPGSGKTIGCILKEKAIKDKKRCGASSRPSKKSGAIRNASVFA